METCVPPRVPAVAFLQDGTICHAQEPPLPLRKRICRATHLLGVRDGYLPDAVPCRAWVAASGTKGGASPACAARSLCAVVQSTEAGNTTSYVRELQVSALLSWAQPAADVLTWQGILAAGTPAAICLLAIPQSGGSNAPWALPPFTIVETAEEHTTGRGTSLHPAQDYAGDLPIHMPAEVLEESVVFCQGDTAVERGGVYVGHLSRDLAEGLYVDVRHFIPAEAVATATSLRFTPDTWAGIHKRRRALDPKLQAVGWVHSHLLHALASQECDGLFLSDVDVEAMLAFYDAPCQFAVVVAGDGPAAPEAACASFGWDDFGVGLRQRSLCVMEGSGRP
jgi:hypothetical protein